MRRHDYKVIIQIDFHDISVFKVNIHNNLFTAASTKQSAIDALDKEFSKVSVAAGEAKDAANKALADGKQAVDETKKAAQAVADDGKRVHDQTKGKTVGNKRDSLKVVGYPELLLSV